MATEDYLFDVLKIKEPTLFLWRNDKTVIIGEHKIEISEFLRKTLKSLERMLGLKNVN